MQFPNNLSFILRREGYVPGVVQNTDIVGFEVSGLKVHKNEGQNGISLHSELLVEIVKYCLDWQDNIHWLSIEKVVQILFSQHDLGAVRSWFGKENIDLDLFILYVDLKNLFRRIRKGASTVLVAQNLLDV